MAIISISKGSYCRGAEVAEKVARRLRYDCLARDVVLEASEEFNVPELKLTKAIEDPPTFFERLTHGRARYVVFIRAALLKHFLADNVVYHGLAGQFFLKGVSHVLKVRIIADLDDRIEIVVARDNVSELEARDTVEKSDISRRQWGQHLYGIDPEDPSLYDAVVHVGRMGTDGAANMICNLVKQDPFQTTPESHAAIVDLALAASVEAVLVDTGVNLRDVEVSATKGEVLVRLKGLPHVHGGTDSEFRKHYFEDLRRRLIKRTLGLAELKAVAIELADH